MKKAIYMVNQKIQTSNTRSSCLSIFEEQKPSEHPTNSLSIFGLSLSAFSDLNETVLFVKLLISLQKTI